MKVSNMTSSNGNKIANQFVIIDGNLEYFQSYDSVVVKVDNSKGHFNQTVYLDERLWDYSRTTGRYRNQFLGETKAETQKKIDSGEYILTNLN